MEKVQILQKLDKNLKNLDDVDREIAMLQLAIYEKSIDKLKASKLDELKNIFESQAKLYNQKTEDYEEIINKKLEKYQKEIQKLINVYNELYLKTFSMMQNALDNQKIAIGNILAMSKKLENKEITQEEEKETRNIMIACAQKKLNYYVIVEECRARLDWCIENIQRDINEIFINNLKQLIVYKEDLFTKIKRNIFNLFSGRNKYKQFLNDYENTYLKNIRIKNRLKILDVCSVLKGVIKQIKIVKEQINSKYAEMLGN